MNNRLSALSVLIISLFFMTGCQSDDQHVIINSGDQRVEVGVEVVLSDEDRQTGLMGRRKLADGTGMLFLFGPDQQPSMWMKNMLISLDIVFIGEDLKINHIEENVNPCDLADDAGCARYQSPSVTPLVLELPAGFTGKKGIEVGNSVELVGIRGF